MTDNTSFVAICKLSEMTEYDLGWWDAYAQNNDHVCCARHVHTDQFVVCNKDATISSVIKYLISPNLDIAQQACDFLCEQEWSLCDRVNMVHMSSLISSCENMSELSVAIERLKYVLDKVFINTEFQGAGTNLEIAVRNAFINIMFTPFIIDIIGDALDKRSTKDLLWSYGTTDHRHVFGMMVHVVKDIIHFHKTYLTTQEI